MVEIKKDLLAPCGLYCGVCSIYIADRDNNLKFKQSIVKLYQPLTKTPEDISCPGCMSDNQDNLFIFCKTCGIRKCIKEKGFEGCHECEKFPCWRINRFPVPVGKKVIMRTIPYWKEHGTEMYVESEVKRYRCPECGNPLFRGAKRCNKCKNAVDVD
jgi:predicted RNA-binding Zn-ribbon protein involved in translation (DUF1610 family)